MCVHVCVCACTLSCIQLFVILWMVTHYIPLSMEFSRHEYWNGLPFPSPGDLPDPGIEPGLPVLLADPLLAEPPGKLVRSNFTGTSLVPFLAKWGVTEPQR